MKLSTFLFTAFIFIATAYHQTCFGQTLTKRPNVNFNANCNGYLEVLPAGYSTASTTVYPLIIYFPGNGTIGPGTDPSLQAMISGSPGNPANGFIHDQVAAGTWPASFSGGNQFIVITPQFVSNFPTPAEVDDILNDIITTYGTPTIANNKIDITRIYLSGNSSGGGPVWDYPAASSAYADRIAAIVPFSPTTFPSKEKADVIRNSHLPVWAFHNEFDAGVPSAFTKDFVALVNRPTPASPQVKQTLPPLTSHDAYYGPLNRTYTEAGLNVFDWMLQFQRIAPKAKAGNDENITQPSSSVNLSGTGTGPNGTTSNISWTKISGPAVGTITTPNSLSTSVTGLTAIGTYVYRLTLTDNAAGTSTDDVVINVYPVRIQAESPANSSGLSSVAAVDEGGGSSMQSWDGVGDFGEYTVNVPTSGTYTLRLRMAAWYTAPVMVVKHNGSTIATFNVYWTTSWDNYMTMTRQVFLPAGTQTLRIESTAQDVNLNWFQLLDAAFSGILPVKFSLVNATCSGSNVKVSWRTELEENLENFSIEKSADGRTWRSLSTVKANNQPGAEQNYSFTDVEGGYNSQYRIVGNDIDGQKTYSTIIRTSCGNKSLFNVFPNPIADETNISIKADKATKLKLILIDSKGAVVKQQENLILEGMNQLPLSLRSLPAGTYTLTAHWEGEVKSVKLFKQ